MLADRGSASPGVERTARLYCAPARDGVLRLGKPRRAGDGKLVGETTLGDPTHSLVRFRSVRACARGLILSTVGNRACVFMRERAGGGLSLTNDIKTH